MTFSEFQEQLATLKTDSGRAEYRVEGLSIQRVVVNDPVPLRGVRFDQPVIIRHITFTQFVDFSEWRCDASLRIEHCTFEAGLRLADTHIGGLCSLKECTFDDPHRGWLDFRRMQIAGLLDATNITSAVSIDMANLQTGDDAWFSGADLTAMLRTRDNPEPQKPRLDDDRLASIQANWKDDLECQANTKYLLDRALHLTGASIGKSLFLQDDAGRPVKVNGMLDLRAKVTGQVAISNATITAKDSTMALDMETATVGGAVFILGTNITGQVDLRAKVTGNVEISNATITATELTIALNMYAATVGGSLFIGDQTRIRGQIWLFQATLGGLFVTSNVREIKFAIPRANQTQPSRQALIEGTINLTYATIHGPCQIHQLSHFGQFIARHLTVHGDFDLCGSIVGTTKTSKQQKWLDEEFKKPELKKRWFVELEELSKKSEPFKKWFAEYKELCKEFEPTKKLFDELVKLRNKFEPSENWLAELDKLFQKIEPTGKWSAEETDHRMTFVKDENTVDLEMAEIHGRCWLKGTRVLGNVYLEDAEIVGEANFDEGEVYGDLQLRSSIIKGRVFADEKSSATSYPRVKGVVDLSYANVQQVDVKLEDSKPNDAQAFRPEKIDLTGATIDTFSLRGEADCESEFGIVTEQSTIQTIQCQDLENVKGIPSPRTKMDLCRNWVFIILVLAIGHLFWMNPSSFAIVAFGLFIAYNAVPWFQRRDPRNKDKTDKKEITDKDKDKEKKKRILAHLHLTKPFSRGYYVMVEQRLRSKGEDETADDVFLMRRKRERQEMGGIQPWSFFLDFIMGYGVRMPRLFVIYFLIGFLNWGIFLDKNSVERPIVFVQNRTDGPAWGNANEEPGSDATKIVKNVWPSDGGRAVGHGEWDSKHAFFMALRLQIPIIQLVTENDWTPATRPMECWLFRWSGISYADFASITMVLNLLLIPLLITGLTGYNKKL